MEPADYKRLINIRNREGRTAIHCAVKQADQTTFDFLINAPDRNLNTQDFEGNSPLHAACINTGKRGKQAGYFIKKLVRLEANKELLNEYNQRPRDLIPEPYVGLKGLLS